MFGEVIVTDYKTGIKYRLRVNGGVVLFGPANQKRYEDEPLRDIRHAEALAIVRQLEDFLLGRE